ncbi:MAG: hydrogenase maturation protease [Gammaproteobacteria bacterium]|nr:hydrogenase maturation protease [Gammaproteobacteria bacterium]
MRRVICLGSYQGNDALAWQLADALEQGVEQRGDVEVLRCASPAQMLGLCAGTTALMVIDATLNLPPGCVRSVSEAELVERPGCSSHGVDLLTVLGVARALGDLPPQCVILGLGVDDGAPEQLVQRFLPAVLAELEKI